MAEEIDTKEKVSRSLKTLEELKRKEEIKEIIERFPSILKISSISFRETESHIRQARPTVRCLHNIRTKDLIRKVINGQWKIKSPRIVVLIMSNVASLHNWTNAKQIKSFQKGLMKAAENTNMWLITNGIDMGATTIIGNAVSDYIAEAKYKRLTHRDKPFSQFNFIGIANENMVKYMKSIETSDDLKIEVDPSISHGESGKYGLNQNLSHYILINDKSDDKNGVNIFLENLTQFLSLSQEDALAAPDEDKEDRISLETSEIPIVSLIIKGGFGCAQLVLRQIEMLIPVVVLKGSGGLADLLAFVELEVRDRGFAEWDSEFVEAHLRPELTNRIYSLFPHYRSNDDEMKYFRHRILETVRKSRTPEGQTYLTVINMYETYTCNLENLTEMLLSALFKSQQTTPTEIQQELKSPSRIKTDRIKSDLGLCVDWNCPDVAKKEVLTKDVSFSLNDEKRLFEDALIRKNRCDFVDLFLSQKFRLRSFLTPKRLKRMFRRIHLSEFFSNVCWEGILGRTSDVKQSDRFIDRELNWLVEACTGNSTFFDESELTLFVTGQFPDSEREAERKSLEIIVLWGIFHFRKRLVRILWRHSDRPINLALIIAMCYDRLSWYVTEQSLSDDLKAESKQFVAFALSVVDKCYKESALRSENVLNEAPKDWNYKTAVDLAAFGRFREFFSHPSCQRWLTNKFYGNIAVRDLRQKWFRLPTLAKILLSAYLIFPINWWIRITNLPKSEEEEEVEDIDDDEEQQKKKTKDNVAKNHKKKDDKQDKEPGDSSASSTTSSIASTTPTKKGEKEEQKPELIRAPEPKNEVVADKKSPVFSQPPIWVFIYELWTAPITKFWNFQFFYTFYLSIFSVALLYPRCGNLSLDIIVSIWSALLLLDDCRQTYILKYTNANVSISIRLTEIVLKSLFLSVFTLSRVLFPLLWPSYSLLTAYQEKILMSLAILHAFYVLLSKFLPISATLGPLLYRLRIMLLVDFLNFIRLSILVMISFGVVIQAVIYPDLDLDNELIRRAFHRAFFTLFLTPADELLGPGSLCSASIYYDRNCKVAGFWPYIFMISYLILLKLILMTLLFALFSSSASSLTADTDAIWKFQRYGLVLDFASRGPLPPPLNIFYYGFLIFRWLINFCSKEGIRKTHFKLSDFTLFILYSRAQPHSRHLLDDEYNYFKLLASETFDEFENKKTAEHLADLQWERIQALSEDSEFQRQTLRTLKGKISEIDRYLKNKFSEQKEQK